MTQFYDEISYGDLHVTGTVYGWTTLPSTRLFYTGSGTCNGLCGTSQVKTLIQQTLADRGRLASDGDSCRARCFMSPMFRDTSFRA